MSEKWDPYNLDLELPDGRGFISLPPKLSLEEYDAWCEEYWTSENRPKREMVVRDFEEFTM